MSDTEKTGTRRRRWLRPMLAGTGVTIALGAGGLWFLTATTPGINALASFAGSMAKDTAGLEITADGLEGSLWGRISARRITLRGDDGLDLAIENALLDWTPSRLFEKTVGISELSASDVALTLPETAETTEDEESSATSIPALALNLEKLALPSISLRVTGRDTPYRFALNARASRTEAGISNLVAALETLDGSEDSLKLDATLDPASETLALDSVLHVSTDGPIAALAGLTGSLSAPIDLEIAGNGPLQTWQGKLRSKYGTLLHWEAGIGAALTEAPVLAIDGIAEVRDPAAFAMPPVLGGGYRHALEIRRDGDGRITVQNIDITLADRFSAAGSLAYEPENNAIGGNLDIRAMEGLSAIADGAVSWQEVFATIGISGTADKPAAEIAANITGFDVPDILKADLALDGQLSSIADGGYRLALTSDIHPESLPDPALAPLAGERVHVELDAATAKDFSTFTIARLDLKGAAVTVNGKGSVAASGALDALAARVSLSDLAALNPLTGMDMAGRADLVIGSLTGTPGESMASDVTLTISELATGVGDLDRLLGRQASIRGRLELQGTESVSLQSLNFASAGLTVKGSAGYGITGGELTAKLDGNIARSALPDIPDLQFNGDPAFNVTLTGPATAPGGAITVTLDGLTAAGYRLTAIDLRAKPGWTEGDSTTDLTLRAKLNGQALALSSRIRIRSDRLDIAAIKGSLGDLALSGELTLPDYGPLLQGRVGIDPGKGNTVAALAGTPVSLDGGMIDVTFTPDGNRQSITASSRLNGVTVRDDANAVIAAIRETRLDAEISDAFGDLRFTASAGAEQLAAAGNRIDDLKAKARGTLTGIDYDLSAGGTVNGKKTGLTAAGKLAMDGERITIAVNQGKASHGTLTADVADPVTVSLTGGVPQSASGKLSVAGGRITLDLAGKPADRRLNLNAENIDLAPLAKLAGQPDSSGRVNAAIRLQTVGKASGGEISITFTGLKNANLPQVDPIGLAITGRLDGGRLKLRAEPDGLALDRGQLEADLPFRFSLADFSFALPGSEPMTATARLDGDIGAVWPLVPLPEHQLDGKFSVNAEVTGTPDDPAMGGSITLTGGTYEHLEFGTRFEDIALEAKLEGERMTLTRFTASDGAGGTLSVRGEATIADGRPRFDFIMDAVNARLAHRDDLEVHASANLTAKGDADGGRISGTVTVGRTEYNLAAALPPSVASLEIENDPARKAEPADETSPYPLALEITVNIPGQVFIRGRGLDSEWGGKLNITGTADEPRINGNLKAVRGQMDIIGKVFDIRESEIRFSGANPINPKLDIAGHYSTADISVSARLAGSAARPEIRLSSVPSMPKDEILSRVLFGTGKANLGPLQAAQLAAAAADLSGLGGGTDIIGRLRRLAGVDVLRVENGAGGPAVSAGKYITDNVYVGAKQGAKPGSSGVEVEVEVTPNISVKSETGQTGDSNIGVQFKWDY